MVNLDVCDGAHRYFVMKKSQRSEVKLQRWECSRHHAHRRGRGEWVIRAGSEERTEGSRGGDRKSKSPPCRRKRDKGGAPSRVERNKRMGQPPKNPKRWADVESHPSKGGGWSTRRWSRTVSAVGQATLRLRSGQASRKAREVAHPQLFRFNVKRQTHVIYLR